MADHLIQKGATWHVRIDVPDYAKSHREIRGRKVLSKSLRTASRTQAKQRALVFLAQWKAWFAEAKNAPTPDEEKAAAIIETLQQELVWGTPRKRILELVDKGYVSYKQTKLARGGWSGTFTALKPWPKKEAPLSERMFPAFKAYQTSFELKDKTIDARLACVRTIGDFLKAERLELSFTSVAKFLKEFPRSAQTKRNHLQAGSAYWKFLQEEAPELFGDIPNPFQGHVVRESKNKVDRQEFTIAELQRLHKAALEKGDQELADLIKIGAYTGARIEEICRLTRQSISNDTLYIKDAKTSAGNRVIPIHSEISELLQGRASKSKDGYLIEGSDKNRYGLRSDPLSKRFGRLKTELGFGLAHVFHSIRKSFVTLLEQEGVPENVTADIVGHEKKTMSYGLYSGGTSLRQKREAIELIKLSLD